MHIIKGACNVKIGRDPGIREQQHSQAARNREFCTARIWLYARRSRPRRSHRRAFGHGRNRHGRIAAIPGAAQSAASDEMRKQVLKGMRAKTEPGGVILVQRAYTERDTGIVSAGWLQSAAK